MEDIFVYQLNPNPEAPIPDIEGLAEIKAAIRAWSFYTEARKQYEEGFILDMPEKPHVSVGALEQKHPRAAAYLTAETWQKSASAVRARLGKQACEKILAGEDHAKALEEMESGWAAFQVAQGG